MSYKLLSRLSSAAALLALCASAQAATKQVCESITNVPVGYLTIATGIADSSCPSRKANKFSTPYNGLMIVKPAELQKFSPPYVVDMHNVVGALTSYRITLLKDNTVGCASPALRFMNYITKPAGVVSGCAKTGPGVDNAVKYYQVMYVEFARTPGSPGVVRVQLNPNNGPSTYISIKTTVSLNGGTQSVVKSPITSGGSFNLNYLAPDYVALAAQGANFTFEVQTFQGQTAIAAETLTATGAELIGQ